MLGMFRSKQKIFCIGRNKTGTTSLKRALSDLGFRIGNQFRAERLVQNYARGDWAPIIKFCRTADAFQDAPFSWPYTWLILHEHFPDARFILTYRDPEDWFRSLIRFHAKKFGTDGNPPTREQLQKAEYRYTGLMWEFNRAVFKTPEDDLYNKEELLRGYEAHNYSVRHFFQDKPNFIEIDLSVSSDYRRLCEFLGKEPKYDDFPHLNASK
ncbi:MAG: hypothetical protein DWQ47_08325 [Acidobacteria bacterium]|nr:MAG: hypothetical protein DWQ32_16425 [Acidobacteriota bacterium]REJ99085.1 MAG: hypothetical protein DWQ38_13555 [Acidobacteriota bacterium]REK16195.1 MAG: hypothetical protein DWQ43_04135 [Acidobacteriota bacterium]REK43876.1 MAG: hypothetical protein DWQ47_08325 [Acidobacteriota bacterium]